jgi:hypothetical protein
MAVDVGPIADMALGAMKAPHRTVPPATIFGPQITKQSQERLYHPLVSVVQASLADPSLSPTDRQNVLAARLAWVTARKAKAESALTAIGVDTSLPSSLAQKSVIDRKSSGDPHLQWPLSTKFRVHQLWFRLLAGDKSGTPDDTGDFVNTDQAFAALTDPSVVGAASQTAVASARLLRQMRCLADVYARWEMGARVALMLKDDQKSGAELPQKQLLARVLALARIEGDLSIPPEDDTLQGTDPGAASGIKLPPGRAHFKYILNPSAHMRCVTYLAVAKDFPDVAAGPYVPGFPVGWKLSLPGAFKTVADFGFTIVLGGLDILWWMPFQTAAEGLAPGAGTFVSAGQFDWPALNRGLSGGLADPEGAAMDDYETRMGLLTATTVVTGPPPVSRMTACAQSDYKGDYSGAGAHYAAMVISEGVRYLNRLAYGPTRFGPGGTIAQQLPEILVYLWYTTKDNDGLGLLASAAGSALRSNHVSNYSTALKTALQGSAAYTPALAKTLDSVVHAPKADSPLIAKAHWPEIAPLLGDSSVIGKLADYIRHESDEVWKGWPDIRRNCIGYAQLYDYYVYQLTGSWPL